MDQNKKDDNEHAIHCCPFVLAKCKFFFIINDDELHVHHHFLYKVTKKQKLDNDNEHVAHHCPLCFF
jgi:hypothetical protein